MSSKLIINKKDDHLFELAGSLDENADFSQIRKSKGIDLFFDLKNIDRITSLGISKWVSLMNEMRETKITFKSCPISVVEQINMIKEFKGSAQIESFFAPFICPDCHKEHEKDSI